MQTHPNVMLSQSLKHLEEYGIVNRQQYNEVPVRVEYQLTDNGRTLLNVLRQLNDWGNQYISQDSKYVSHCKNCLFYDIEYL